MAPTLTGNVTNHNIISNLFQNQAELPQSFLETETWTLDPERVEGYATNILTLGAEEFLSKGPWDPVHEMELAYKCYLHEALLKIRRSTYKVDSQAEDDFSQALMQEYMTEDIENHQCTENDRNLISVASVYLLSQKVGTLFENDQHINNGNWFGLGSFIADFADLVIGRSFDPNEAIDKHYQSKSLRTDVIFNNR